MHLQPLDDRAVVLRDQAPERTESGIFIPKTHAEKPIRGTVLAVGPSESLKDVSIGDRLIFDKYAGIDVEIDGREVTVIRAADIMGVLKEDN